MAALAPEQTDPKQRGLLIVIEGLDRAGKSTQCELLCKLLANRNTPCKHLHFPLRTTSVGKIIDDYLNKRTELHDAAVHLLFSANRWECVPDMLSDMESGTTLIVDRYSYSGVAFTAAKPGFSIDWCKGPDTGLPRPDLVILLSLPQTEAAGRESFGAERYEVDSFQEKVMTNFELMREPHWKVVDASRTIEDIHKDIGDIVLTAVNEMRDRAVGKLWT